MTTLLLASEAADAGNVLFQMEQVDVESFLLPLLIQLTILIVVARVFAALFRRLGQPAVVGEIAAGLVLGPSVLGKFSPELFNALFHPTLHGLSPEASDVLTSKVLITLSQLGLIFLLFLVGLQFDFGHLRWNGKTALAVSISGIALPFGLGAGLGVFMHPVVAADLPWVGFVLFMGLSLSITAMPVLGRIMLELGITRSRLATLTISAAAVGDAVGWILLATVAAATRAAFDPTNTALMIAGTVCFTALMVFAVRPVLKKVLHQLMKHRDGEISVNALSGTLALLFLCAVATNLIGIFAVFGAFLLGAILSDEHDFCVAINRRLRDFVTSFFLPIFFAYTGLRTDIGSLESWHLWLLAAAVTGMAVAGKFFGSTAAAWLTGMPIRESACIGILMNARGLMELIVVNVGRDLGVIPPSVFCMLVLMALITTVMTTPLVLRCMRGTELEPYILRSGFLGKQAQSQQPHPEPTAHG